MNSFFRKSSPALLAAILNLLPDLFPFLSPLQWFNADDTNLFKEIGLLVYVAIQCGLSLFTIHTSFDNSMIRVC